MSSIDFRELTQDTLVTLFKIDLNPVGVSEVLRLTNHTASGGDVFYGGVAYSPFPVFSDGWEVSSSGQLPTPTLSVSNVFKDFSNLVLSYDDLIGAEVTRIRTLAKYLDNGSSPSTVKRLPDDIWVVERKTKVDEFVVSFELASALDLGDFQLPSRPIMNNLCPWRYRGAECGYAGPAKADEFDNPTSSMAEDKCGKRLSSCQLRFGRTAELPIGSFPGVDIARGE